MIFVMVIMSNEEMTMHYSLGTNPFYEVCMNNEQVQGNLLLNPPGGTYLASFVGRIKKLQR